MGRRKVVHECAGCGRPTLRRGRATDGVRCLDCSIERSQQAARQIRQGYGEFYDRWLIGMQKALERQVAQVRADLIADGEERLE